MKSIKFILFTGMFAAGFIACGGNSTGPVDPPEETAFMTVSPRSYAIGSEGGTINVTVSSNRTFSATPERTWCKAEVLSGDTGNLKLTITPNTSFLRAVGILLEAPGCPSIELTVTQDAYVDPSDPDGDDKDYLEFRAASYNIRYNAAADVESGNGWNVRKGPLATVILNYGFDIVGTQEGSNSQLDELKPLLGGFDYFKHPYGSNLQGTSHNCATFYRTDKFTLLESGVFYYSETPDTPSKGWDGDYRICSWGKFREKTTSLEFYFFNSHFYWQGTQARPPSGPIHAQKVEEIAENSPAISTGDFNSTVSTSQISAIMTVLGDSYSLTEKPRVGPDGTSFPGGVFEGTPGSRIDFIFVSKDFKVRDYKVLEDQYFSGGRNRYPSDHLPVTSMLAIEKP